MTLAVDVFMVAIGEDHQAMADVTMSRAARVLKLPVNLICVGDPFEVKLSLLETAKRHVLFLDCDLVLFGWDWSAFDFTCFNAAPDMLHPSWPGTKAIKDLMPNPNVHTFNTGLWFAPPSCKPLFRFAKMLEKELQDFEYKLGDQTPLNLAIQRSMARVNTLPQRFNRQYSPKARPEPPPGKDFGVHLVGGTFEGDTKTKLERVLNYARIHP